MKKISSFSKIFNNPIILLLVLAIVHFLLPIIVTWDSAHYLSYSPIISGSESWRSWDIVRGPVFPFFLYLITKVSIISPYLCFKLFSLLMLFISFFLIQKILKYQNLVSLKNSSFYTFLLLINPVVMGYLNSMLTEFLAVVFFLCFIIFSFQKKNLEGWRKYVNIFFQILICQVLYLLKQPYLLFPLLIVFFSIFNEYGKNFSVLFKKSFYMFCFVLCVLVAPFIWGKYLKYKGIQDQPTRSFSAILFYQLISASREIKVDFNKSNGNCSIEISNFNVANKILKSIPCENIKSSKNFIGYVWEIYSTNYPSYLSSLGKNFFGILGLLEVGAFSSEDYAIALRTFRLNDITSNVFYLSDELSIFAEPFRIESSKFSYLNQLGPITYLFQLFRFFVVILTLVFVLYYLINRKKINTDFVERSFIVILAGLVYIGVHAIIAFPIDRYGFPIFFIWAIFIPFMYNYFDEIVKLNRRCSSFKAFINKFRNS